MQRDALHDALPAPVAERLQSLRLADGVVTVVLDGSGLDRAAQGTLRDTATAALDGQPGVVAVRVAVIADKVQPRIVAIGSGKGGVGKSTVAANLAVALARSGRRVGMVDADIYGPSQPRLFATEGVTPDARDSKMIPVPSAFGVGVLSMGQLIDAGRAIAWRGPMVGKALSQLIDAHWDVDVLIVDLPPGTGDVQLTMLQRFKPAGAVVVSTPQDLALIDATRALDLFRQGGVPVIGMIENMAGYACPHCGKVSDPFGRGGAEATAATLGLDFLGRIPLEASIRARSDAGSPPAAGNDASAAVFADLAARLGDWLDRTCG